MKSLVKNTKLNQNKKEEKKCIVVVMGMCVLGTSWEEAKGGYPGARRLRAVGDSGPLCISRNAQSRF